MKKFYHLFLIYSLLLGAIIVSFPATLGISKREFDTYDKKLSSFLLEVLDNFRNEMPYGIPDIGVPVLDPFTLKDVNERIINRGANILFRMRKIKIAGLSRFQINDLKADLERGFANFSMDIPELNMTGYCYMKGKIFGIFSIKGDGPFAIHVKKVRIKVHGKVDVSIGGEFQIRMADLRMQITFGSLNLEFDSLFGGGRWTRLLLKLASKLGRFLFMRFNEKIMRKLERALLKEINEKLEEFTDKYNHGY